MRSSLTEFKKQTGQTQETTCSSKNWQYDNINRLIFEQANATDGVNTDTYDERFWYDLKGNRLCRLINANSQSLQTDYSYNELDQLITELHSQPVGVIPYGKDYAYVYADSGRITHYVLSNGERISQFKAFFIGLPSKWSGYLLGACLIVLPIILLTYLFEWLYLKMRGETAKDRISKLSLFRRCVCILLCYTVFLSTIGLEPIANAATQYHQLATTNWGTAGDTFTYDYDANGSLLRKHYGGPSAPFDEYGYDLHNRLVSFTPNGGTAVSYKYNPDGIRVQKHVTGTDAVNYLIDPQNHTGYAQVLRESQGTNQNTYIIGSDVLAEATSVSDITYLVYDGQGSVRHHLAGSGAFVDYQYTVGQQNYTCDTFSYDSYGQRIDPLKDTLSEGLFYTGEMYDSDLSHYYLRARYYNPLNGLFNQLDSYSGNTQDPQSLHKYLYCHNNPVNSIDPSGLMNITGLNISIMIGSIITVTGLTVYNGIRHGSSAITIAWQVVQNLATFGAILGAIVLSGPIAIIAAATLAISFIVGLISIVRNWSSMDTTDKVIMAVTFVAFLAFSGAAKGSVPPKPSIQPGQTVNPLPDSYFSKFTVDMRNAPSGSSTTLLGYARNAPWFWKQVYNAHPEYFSAGNLERIQAISPRSPVIDAQWIRYHPQHSSFMGETLIHHHIGQGPIATAIPQSIHQSWTSFLHPYGGKQ